MIARFDTPAGRRAARWLAAAAVIALLLLLAWSTGRDRPGQLAGWLPADAQGYAELRVDPPGDQAVNLGRWLARQTGSSDPSTLRETFGSAVRSFIGALAANTIDDAGLQAWLGDTVAVGLIPAGPGNPLPGRLLIVRVRDRGAAAAWLRERAAERRTEAVVAGPAGLIVEGRGEAIGLERDVLLVGPSGAVRTALETGGRSSFPAGARFAAAVAAVRQPAIVFAALEVPTRWSLALRVEPQGIAGTALIDASAPTADATRPAASGRPSLTDGSLAGYIPADASWAIESADAAVGVASLLGSLGSLGRVAGGDGTTGSAGTLGPLGSLFTSEGLAGLAGDVALVGLPPPSGMDGAGSSRTASSALVVAVRDRAALSGAFNALRLALRFGGRAFPAGVATEVPHGNSSIIVLRVPGLLTSVLGADVLPVPLARALARLGGSIALSAVDGAILIAGKPETVGQLLDVTAGTSLRAANGYRSAFTRLGAGGTGRLYVDAAGIAAWMETALSPLARAALTQRKMAIPGPITAIAGTISPGDPIRVRFVVDTN